MRMVAVLATLAMIVAGCSSTAATTTTGPGTTSATSGATTSTPVPTTQPVVSVDASFAIGAVIFGEQGRIEVVNNGSQTGNVHGFWIAIHPFYLELPSAIIEVGDRVIVTLDPDEPPDALVHAAGLLPTLAATDGEVGLYANGNFADPTAIVDYVEWGSGGHFRSTVAEAAGIWDITRVVATQGDEGGLIAVPGGTPQLLDAELQPLSADG